MTGQRYTQDDVASWCRQHYPGETRAQMVRNLVEEVGELGCELDADIEDLVAVLRKSMARGKAGTREDLRGEIADVQISVYNLADMVKESALDCLDTKMNKLIQRTPEESASRVRAKMEKGIRQELPSELEPNDA